MEVQVSLEKKRWGRIFYFKTPELKLSSSPVNLKRKQPETDGPGYKINKCDSVEMLGDKNKEGFIMWAQFAFHSQISHQRPHTKFTEALPNSRDPTLLCNRDWGNNSWATRKEKMCFSTLLWWANPGIPAINCKIIFFLLDTTTGKTIQHLDWNLWVYCYAEPPENRIWKQEKELLML